METLKEEMLRLALGGDAHALEILLASHHQQLLLYTSRHLPPDLRRLVEPIDVVQDTYFEACRRFDRFNPAGDNALGRWLLTIARHRIVYLVRLQRAAKRGRGAVASLDDQRPDLVAMLGRLASLRRSPSQSAVAHEFMLALERAVEQLPPDYKRLITLRFMEGCDIDETASRMGRTRGAVHMLSARALDALRRELRSASLYG